MKVIRTLAVQLRRDTRGISTTELGAIFALVTIGSLQALSALGGEVEGNLDSTKATVGDNRKFADPFAGGAGANSEPANPGTMQPPTNPGAANEPPAAAADEPPIAAAKVAPKDPIYDEPAPVQLIPPEN